MTLTEVAAQLGKSVSAVERASAKLVADGKLRYVGPKKGCQQLNNSWTNIAKDAIVAP